MNDQFRKTAEKFHKEYLHKKRWKKAVKAILERFEGSLSNNKGNVDF